MRTLKKLRNSLGPLVGLSLFIVALLVIHNELKEYHYHDIVRHLQEIPVGRIIAGLVLTVFNYLIMTGYDILALKYINYTLAYRRIAMASFIGYAFSNNIGFSMLAGSSVRYRLYSAWGLSSEQITQIVAFCTLTLWMGLFTIGGVTFLLEPIDIPEFLHLPFASVRFIGIIFLLLIGTYVFWHLTRKGPLRIFGWEFPLPEPRMLIAQTIIASFDWLLAGSVLFVIIPESAGISFLKFTGIYLLAQIAGLVSQIPGGLGVFETVVLVLLSKDVPAAAILGSLVAYRAIYYIVPLCTAAVMLGVREALEKKEGIRRALEFFGQRVTWLIPNVLSITTFLSGMILLFSGATPTMEHRLMWLKDFLPLPVMEISHFLGSLAGMGLLLLARGIQVRLDAAYLLTIVLLISGFIFSLLKGFDYEEAFALAVMLIAIIPCRKYFYRKASIFSQRFTPVWIAAVAAILLSTIWLGIFSYKHVEFSGELWWQFTFSGDASRFLRATVGTLAMVIIVAFGILLRPSQVAPPLSGASEVKKAKAVVERSKKTYAYLALLGDKNILFSKSEKSFIMYGIEGRSWIALGDPVGEDAEMTELAWQFRELSDRYSGWTIFYEVGKENLHLYLDIGLSVIKIGEEARVRLETFSLEGKTHKGFRHTVNQIEKEGCTFRIIPAEDISSFFPELRQLSDVWLAHKNTGEKRFSLGFFNEEYLKNFPFAVVIKEGKIIAFANIWHGAEKDELSIDLMRFIPDAPHGIMDYLFINLLIYGKQEGYNWFNLGMAPFSGFQENPLAPLWSRLGAFIFRHGEHFYNFRGLRQYKDKFDPVWEPKYLALPGGLKLPRILTNIAALVSGGLKGAVTK